jgi:hypothetical protein
MSEAIEGIVICGETEAFCICTQPKDHDGPHECGHDGGQWHYDENGNFHIDRLPTLNGA